MWRQIPRFSACGTPPGPEDGPQCDNDGKEAMRLRTCIRLLQLESLQALRDLFEAWAPRRLRTPARGEQRSQLMVRTQPAHPNSATRRRTELTGCGKLRNLMLPL